MCQISPASAQKSGALFPVIVDGCLLTRHSEQRTSRESTHSILLLSLPGLGLLSLGGGTAVAEHEEQRKYPCVKLLIRRHTLYGFYDLYNSFIIQLNYRAAFRFRRNS